MLKQALIQIVFGTFLVLAVSAASADQEPTVVQTKEGILAGSACGKTNSVIELGAITDKIFRVDVAAEVLKLGTERFKRASCNFAIPVKVAANKRLVLRDLQVPSFISLARGATGEATLEIFSAGKRGEKTIFRQKAEVNRISQEVLFEKEGVLFRSACGESLNLRGNIALSLKDGIQRSILILDVVELRAEVEDCL